jgi:hypothetical protein
MSDAAIHDDQTENIHEVTDEELETAGAEGVGGNFTMFCSGISCPG